MYMPAFFEIFLGLVVVLLWWRWLSGRPGVPGVVKTIPWLTGGAVVVGQAAATFMLLSAPSAPGGGSGGDWVALGRYGSAGAVLIALVALLVLTAMSYMRPSESP